MSRPSWGWVGQEFYDIIKCIPIWEFSLLCVYFRKVLDYQDSLSFCLLFHIAVSLNNTKRSDKDMKAF